MLRDLDDEMRFHFQMRVAELQALGMSEREAEAEALRRFGDAEELREYCAHVGERAARWSRAVEWLDSWAQDVRCTVRQLRKAPGFTAAVVLTLALGIGANTTMFGIVDALLLRPPSGVRDPGSLVWIGAERTYPGIGQTDIEGVSYPDYVDFSRSPTLEGAAGYARGPESLGRGTAVQKVNTLVVTHTFMPLLGARPALGQFFGADEDRPGAAAVAVLGYGLWQRQFGGATDVLGKSVRLGTDPYEVVGVAPRDFNGVEREPVDLYVPVAASGRNTSLTVLGRLRRGFRMGRLAEELNVTYHNASGDPDAKNTTIRVASPMATAAMPDPVQVQNVNVSLWLAGVAGVVLLVACANVASLLLTRALRRRREIAVRLALGVGRWRLVRQLLTESVMLAGAGGIAALFVSRWGGAILRATLLPDAAAGATLLDLRVLVVTILATVVTGVACGLAPALQATHPNVTTALKASAREGAAGGGGIRSALLVGQVALTLVLLVGAGLFVRSLQNVRAVDFGFETDHVLLVSIDPSILGYTPQQVPQFYQRLLERVRALPGIQQAALTTGGPFTGMFSRPLSVPGHDQEPGLHPLLNSITPDFFATLGIPLRQGRLLADADRAGAERVAVVNEEMARHYWPAGDALGRCIKIGGDTMPCTTVVGVVPTIRLGYDPEKSIVSERPAKAYYVPLGQTSDGPPKLTLTLYARTTSAAVASVPSVRRAIQEMAPDLPFPHVTALAEELAPQIRPWRMGAGMFGVFAGVALVLAIVGLYGVLAYTVSQRTHEIGVRIALGAQSGNVVRLVVGQGLRLTMLGVGIGVVAALAGGRALAALLFGVSASDPSVFTATAVTLISVAVLASYFPARRAIRIDPTEALRAE
jgi:predicted permease